MERTGAEIRENFFSSQYHYPEKEEEHEPHPLVAKLLDYIGIAILVKVLLFAMILLEFLPKK